MFSIMYSELMIISEISRPLWSSVCKYQSVECAFTSPMSIESGMLVTCCMQCVMSVSTVLQCGDGVSPGSLSVHTVMQWGIFGDLAFCVSFVSCTVMMSGWVLCTSFFSSSILFLMLSMLN